MTLNQKSFAFALAIISGLTSIVCVIFIKIIPGQTMNFFGWLIHINKLADLIGPRTITLEGSIAGIIIFSAAAYILGWLFAFLYNKLAEKQQR